MRFKNISDLIHYILCNNLTENETKLVLIDSFKELYKEGVKQQDLINILNEVINSTQSKQIA